MSSEEMFFWDRAEVGILFSDSHDNEIFGEPDSHISFKVFCRQLWKLEFILNEGIWLFVAWVIEGDLIILLCLLCLFDVVNVLEVPIVFLFKLDKFIRAGLCSFLYEAPSIRLL